MSDCIIQCSQDTKTALVTKMKASADTIKQVFKEKPIEQVDSDKHKLVHG
jgi:hypothetical protein